MLVICTFCGGKENLIGASMKKFVFRGWPLKQLNATTYLSLREEQERMRELKMSRQLKTLIP